MVNRVPAFSATPVPASRPVRETGGDAAVAEEVAAQNRPVQEMGDARVAEEVAARGQQQPEQPGSGEATPSATTPQAQQGAQQVWNATRQQRIGRSGSIAGDIRSGLPSREDNAALGRGYTIRGGDTLSEIAAALRERYGLEQSVREIINALKQENRLRDAGRIREGSTLRLEDTLNRLRPQQAQAPTPAQPVQEMGDARVAEEVSRLPRPVQEMGDARVAEEVGALPRGGSQPAERAERPAGEPAAEQAIEAEPPAVSPQQPWRSGVISV